MTERQKLERKLDKLNRQIADCPPGTETRVRLKTRRATLWRRLSELGWSLSAVTDDRQS